MLITPKMSNILRDIIFEQNKELLTRIANDHFENDEEKEEFVKEFHKKNFAFVNVSKSSRSEEYERKIKRAMR
jgi:hypothetical protein